MIEWHYIEEDGNPENEGYYLVTCETYVSYSDDLDDHAKNRIKAYWEPYRGISYWNGKEWEEDDVNLFNIDDAGCVGLCEANVIYAWADVIMDVPKMIYPSRKIEIDPAKYYLTETQLMSFLDDYKLSFERGIHKVKHIMGNTPRCDECYFYTAKGECEKDNYLDGWCRHEKMVKNWQQRERMKTGANGRCRYWEDAEDRITYYEVETRSPEAWREMHHREDAEGGQAMKVVLDEGAYMPEKAHRADAGYDLRTPKRVVLRRHDRICIDTGVHIAIPDGWYGQLFSKSGLNVKHDIVSLGGTVDSSYTGSVVVKLYNLGEEDYVFEAGDKIVQIVFMPCGNFCMTQVDELEETERGDNGFGSTGK